MSKKVRRFVKEKVAQLDAQGWIHRADPAWRCKNAMRPLTI